MLTEVARVVAIEADSLWVESIRKSTCGSCAVQKGCGHGLLNQIYPGRRNLVRVLPGDIDPQECRVDDEVVIAIPEDVVLRGSFLAYLMPLLCMLGGAALAVALLPGGQDAMAALGATVGLAVGFLLLRWHGVAHRDDRGFQPSLMAVNRSTRLAATAI